MEALSNALFVDLVPDSWQKRAYPSLFGFTLWYADLLLRIKVRKEDSLFNIFKPNCVHMYVMSIHHFIVGFRKFVNLIKNHPLQKWV